MPIRLNLLAEMQALEESRRKDPVKRAVLIAVVLVIAMLGWSGILMIKQMSARGELTAALGTMNSQTNAYTQVVNNEKRLADGKNRLHALVMLTTNRFLNGTLLDVLQRNMVDNVQVTRLKVTQVYILTDETKAAKPADDDTEKRPAVTKPATVTEKVSLSMSATDTSPNGEAATHFQNTLSAAPYFQKILAKTNGFRLTSLGAPQVDPSGRSFTTFTLEANLPDKTR
jgi:hypothetical protein